MDSPWMEARNAGVGNGRTLTITMDTEDSPTISRNEYVPTWKMPISKSFSSLGEKGGSESSGERGDSSNSSDSDSNKRTCPVDLLSSPRTTGKEEDEDQLIQILLPCMICNRTFSPEALERHSAVCTKVNVKTPYKPDRGKFDTAEQRKKGTRVEYFIPPPLESPTDNRLSCFSRGSKNRSSLRGTSCTTRSTLSSETLNLHHNQQLGIGANNSPTTPTPPFRRQRSISQTRGDRGSSRVPSDYPYDDHSEFGSNSEESQTIPDTNLPSYAKPIAPTDECPFCNRFFGHKAYDRHVVYCKEKYVQRQYDLQPTPKEKVEAMERQETRTKYRPMKGSSSCSSLRSVSPGKDFASMAYKLFGLRRTDGTSNLYNNQLTNFKKSNESIANSCYGDYSRGMRRPSPSPSRHGGNAMSVTNKINNLLSKTFHYQQNSNNTTHPMRINTSSNIPKLQLTKSSDNLALTGSGSPYAHVPGSGYGQGGNNFSRNSRSRSSLHKNFFRSKRVEPEGTENTSTMPSSSPNPSPLIITPMTFFTKNKMTSSNHPHQELYRPKGTTLLSQDPSYDPYAMAAKQLEELFKSQPINKNVNKKTARKLGLEKAFESVGVHSDSFTNSNTLQDENRMGRKNNEDSFVFDLANGKMDDSYWDEILQKSSAAQKGKEQSQMSSSETKSQQSDSSIGDSNKSRALSHISSADSGFSRSEVNDAEFEALESIVGIGEMPRQANLKSQSHNSLSSMHPSLSRILDKQPKRSHTSTTSEPQSPMQISPPPVPVSSFSDLQRRDSDSSTGVGVGARFCHECGNSYPSPIAKFCPECGEKRVFRG